MNYPEGARETGDGRLGFDRRVRLFSLLALLPVLMAGLPVAISYAVKLQDRLIVTVVPPAAGSGGCCWLRITGCVCFVLWQNGPAFLGRLRLSRVISGVWRSKSRMPVICGASQSPSIFCGSRCLRHSRRGLGSMCRCWRCLRLFRCRCWWRWCRSHWEAGACGRRRWFTGWGLRVLPPRRRCRSLLPLVWKGWDTGLWRGCSGQ
ncbi:MAG: hypothetical protein ACI853_001264 [Paracoccaceae bacterium]|jgi:hypothetical protein